METRIEKTRRQIRTHADTWFHSSQPVDLALSSDGKYLYNLLRGYGSIEGMAIESDGSLTQLGDFGRGQALPPNNGVSGLAVY